MTPKIPRSFHVVFTDGTEKNYVGSAVATDAGTLLIGNAKGAVALVFAPGTWKRCELETRDE